MSIWKLNWSFPVNLTTFWVDLKSFVIFRYFDKFWVDLKILCHFGPIWHILGPFDAFWVKLKIFRQIENFLVFMVDLRNFGSIRLILRFVIHNKSLEKGFYSIWNISEEGITWDHRGAPLPDADCLHGDVIMCLLAEQARLYNLIFWWLIKFLYNLLKIFSNEIFEKVKLRNSRNVGALGSGGAFGPLRCGSDKYISNIILIFFNILIRNCTAQRTSKNYHENC